jgi:hypothetical protein
VSRGTTEEAAPLIREVSFEAAPPLTAAAALLEVDVGEVGEVHELLQLIVEEACWSRVPLLKGANVEARDG